MIVDLYPWEIGPSFEELDLGHFSLPPRAHCALLDHEIETVGQLAGMTAEALLELKGLGPKSVAAVEAQLHSVALELARPKVPVAHSVAPAADEGPDDDADPCWQGKPHLYQVFRRSGGFFDACPEYKRRESSGLGR